MNRAIMQRMWRDFKMWLIVRYVSSRVFENKSDGEWREKVFILDNLSDKVFGNRKALISEVFKLKKHLYFAMLPPSWRVCMTEDVLFTDWQEINSHTEGSISSIFTSAYEESFFEPLMITTITGPSCGYGYGSGETKIDTSSDKRFIRLSHKGDGFKSWGNLLLYLSRKYWEIWALIWFVILLLANQVFGLWGIVCGTFQDIPMC